MQGVNVLSLPMWSSGANELMEVHPYPWAFSLLTMIISLLESFPCLNITVFQGAGDSGHVHPSLQVKGSQEACCLPEL